MFQLDWVDPADQVDPADLADLADQAYPVDQVDPADLADPAVSPSTQDSHRVCISPLTQLTPQLARYGLEIDQ